MEEQQQAYQFISSSVKRMIRNTNPLLPENIMQDEILIRLPAKSLVRFRSVCKSWKNIFSTFEFVKSHLTRQQSYKDQDLLIGHRELYNHGVIIISRSHESHGTIGPSGYNILIGSINGLVCMASRTHFCLWNPATGQTKEAYLPRHDCKECHHLLGFSWDHVRNDYKVVVVLIEYFRFPKSPLRDLYIYSSNSSRWTEVIVPDNVVMPDRSCFQGSLEMAPSTIVRGHPYWRLISPYLVYPYYVSKFVAGNNEFRLLPRLDVSKFNSRDREFNLVNIEDCLVGMMYERGCLNSLVDIYSLDEESDSGVWSKMYTIGPINLCNQRWWLSQCFKNGGEILIVKDGKLFFYDPKTKETKFVKSTRHTFRRCYSYTPSLVCVQGMESMVLFSSHVKKSKRLAIEYCNYVRRSVSSSSDSSSSSDTDSDSETSSGNDSDAEADSDSDAGTDSNSRTSSGSDSIADEAQS